MPIDRSRLERGAEIFATGKKVLEDWQYRDSLGLSLSDVPSFLMAYVASEMARDDGDYLGQEKEAQSAASSVVESQVNQQPIQLQIDEEKIASRLREFLTEYLSANPVKPQETITPTRNGRVPYVALSASFSIQYDPDAEKDEPEESDDDSDQEPDGTKGGILGFVDVMFGVDENVDTDQEEDDSDDDNGKVAAYISDKVNRTLRVFEKEGFSHVGRYVVGTEEREFDQSGQFSMSADDLTDEDGDAVDASIVVQNQSRNEYLKIEVETVEDGEELTIRYVRHLPEFIQGANNVSDFLGPAKRRLAKLMNKLEEDIGDPKENEYTEESIDFVRSADWFEKFDEE